MRATEFITETPMLYHATYKPFLDSIMKNGLGGSGAQTQWEDSKPGYVYLAKDPEVAVSHAEANEEVPDEYIDDIVVLSIDASQLDQDNLEDDPNVQDDDSTLAYKGIIPSTAFNVQIDELKIEKPEDIEENFADGKVKGKSRPGRVKKSGASCKGSVTSLRAKAKKASGERAKMYHWCANMKSGRKKSKS